MSDAATRARQARNQRARRARLAAQALHEVRGIYAPAGLHGRIRDYAAKQIAERALAVQALAELAERPLCGMDVGGA